jgi:hypothetical protein
MVIWLRQFSQGITSVQECNSLHCCFAQDTKVAPGTDAAAVLAALQRALPAAFFVTHVPPSSSEAAAAAAGVWAVHTCYTAGANCDISAHDETAAAAPVKRSLFFAGAIITACSLACQQPALRCVHEAVCAGWALRT